jgi:hypothetical protein
MNMNFINPGHSYLNASTGFPLMRSSENILRKEGSVLKRID